MIANSSEELDMLPKWAQEELRQGRCAIGRFRGQTHIYIPAHLCERLDDDTIRRLAVEVYSQEAIEAFVMGPIGRKRTYYMFEVPPSFNPEYKDQQDNPKYSQPNELVNRIIALAESAL